MHAPEPELKLADYSVCFIDLLGQKKAMEGQSVLPKINTPEQRDELIRLVKTSVGKIAVVHRRAEMMLGAMHAERDPPGPLDAEKQKIWNAMRVENTVTQRWSDGLMVFACHGDALC
jgi:hypothetical protein